MVEEGFEVLSCNVDASLELCAFLQIDELLDLLHCLSHTRNGCVLLERTDESLRLLDVTSAIVWAINEELVEEVTAPLDTVLDLTGEVTECTHRNSFLGRILRIPVALGLVGDDHLRVSFGSEGARLEKGLSIPDAS